MIFYDIYLLKLDNINLCQLTYRVVHKNRENISQYDNNLFPFQFVWHVMAEYGDVY